MPTPITTEALVDQLFDLLTDQGVPFDDLAAAKAAAVPIFQNWLGGDNALPAETMRTALNVLGRTNGFVVNQYDFWTTPATGGPYANGDFDALMPDGATAPQPGLAKMIAAVDPAGAMEAADAANAAATLANDKAAAAQAVVDAGGTILDAVPLAEAARDGALAAQAAAATSAQAVPIVKAHLGTDLSGVAPATIGVTTPDTSNSGSSFIFGPLEAVAAPGPLSAVRVRMSAAGAGEIHVYVPVAGATYELAAVFPVSLEAGVNELIDFGGLWLPTGGRVHYKWLSGGFLRYVAGGSGAYFAVADVSGLGDEADVAFAANTVAMNFDVLADADNVAGRVSAATVAAAGAASGVAAAQGDIAAARLAVGLDAGLDVVAAGDTDPDGATASASFCWFSKTHLTTLSRLDSFSARMSAAGSGLVLVIAPDDGATEPVVGGSYELLAALPWTWASAGVQTFTGFGGLVAPAGALLGFKAVSGGRPRYAAATPPGIWSTAAADFVDPGDTGVLASANNTVALAFEASINANALAPRLSGLEAGTALPGDDYNAPVYEAQQAFRGASLPADWIETGGWTVSDGLVSPATGGWDVAAYLDAYSSAGQRTIMARLEVLDATGAFGISSDPQEGFAGGQAIVDGEAETLALYTYDGTADAGISVVSTPLPAALNAGDILVLTVKRDDLEITATVTNARTQAGATVTYDYTASLSPSRRPFFHGRPGVVDHGGAGVKALYFAAWAGCVRRLDTLFIGDSNGEGSNDPSVGASWMHQVSALQPGRRLVCARGGDETTNFLDRMASDLRAFRPRRVVLALGTNDTNLDTWRGNLGLIISAVEAVGAEVILCTVPPRTGAQTLRNSQNADMLGGYFGHYRIIDVAAAVTDGHDRVTWDAAKVMADEIHMNAAGQAAAFAQAKIDVPELGVAAA